ncbi:MAG TPA: hypothetical protein VIZ43_03030 [Trebonia sp.]
MPDGNDVNWRPGGHGNGRGGGGGYRDPRASDPRVSGARGGQPPWDQASSDGPSWDQAGQPPWDGSGGPARSPGPRQQNPATGPQDRGQGAADPGRSGDQWRWMAGGRADLRPPELPGEATHPGAAGGRHRTGAPPADPGRQWPDDADSGRQWPDERDRPQGDERGKPGRMMALAGGGLLVAIVLVAFALGLSRGGAVPGAVPSQNPATPGPALTGDVQGAAPGTPTVTARGVSGQKVEFSWTYANSAAGDTFRVLVNGTAQPTTVNTPNLVLSAPPGQQVCVQVQVVNAGNVTSTQSSKACWPS